MPEYFYGEVEWECSSGPILTRAYDASADLWPIGTTGDAQGGAKDVLADGDHPVVAIGPKANRATNLTAVVVSYNSANDRAILNVADKVCVRSYVANVLTYSGTTAWTFDTSMAIGDPVYIDASNALGAGVTLSRSPLNNNSGEHNPLAGYLHYCQREYIDTGVGGEAAYTDAGVATAWPKVIADSLVENVYCIILVNDAGISGLSLDNHSH